MNNLNSGADKNHARGGAVVRPEWRHFTPREKAFILCAVSNCTSGEDVENVIRDYSDAIQFMQARRGLPPDTLSKF